MSGKDIDLIIKAQDRASGELDKISKALKRTVDDQLDLAKGAGKTSDALGKLSSEASKFETELNKLKSAGKIAAELDKATATVGRMESALKTNSVELARMARESAAAAKAANTFKGQLAAEESSLASNKAALAGTRQELANVSKAIRDAEKAQNALNSARSKMVSGNNATNGVGIEAGLSTSSARASSSVFLAADLAAQRAEQARLTSSIKEQETAIVGQNAAIKLLVPQVRAASTVQNKLASETESAAKALTGEKETLTAARATLESTAKVAQEASAALGGIAVSQEQVSAAAQRMAANLAAAKARIEGLTNTRTTTTTATAAIPTGGVDEKALATQRRAMLEARKEWVAAQADVKALAQQMTAASAPTEALGAAFGSAQAKAKQASEAYDAQRAKLLTLAGAARSSFRDFSQAATQMEATGNTSAAANAKIAVAARAAATAQNQLAPAIRSTGSAAGAAAGQTNSFAASLLGVQKDSRETLSLMQRLRGEILSLTASYLGFQAVLSGVGGSLDAYKQLEAVQSRLGAVFDQDTAQVAAQVQYLRQESDRLGITFGTLAEEYGKFAVAAKGANFTARDTREVFISIAEAARVNKLSVEQTSRVFLAFTQMLNKSKIQSQEVVQQLGEALPGATKLFADALGKTTPEFLKLMEAGNVAADKNNLLKVADELRTRFGPQLTAALDTVTTDLGRFENSIFGAQLAVSNGFIPSLREALQSFNAFAESTDGQDAFRNIGATIGDVIKILAELPKYFDLITFAAKAFIGVKIAEFLTGIVGKGVSAAGAMSQFSRELQLVGPRTQAATAAQGIFARSLSQVVSTLGVYRTALLTSTSSTALARAGVLGMAAAIGGLQRALIVTAGIARTFLAAFGGPIGIAIAAITLGVGSWITSVNQASAALDEHQRQLDIVVAGYTSAEDKAGDWVDKLVGVTLAQALDNATKIQTQFNGLLDKAVAKSRVLYAGFADFPDTSKQIKQFRQMEEALEGVRNGTTSVKELENVLSLIALNPAEEQFKQIALEVLSLVNSAEEGEKSLIDLSTGLEVSAAKIRLMRNEATKADEILLKLPGAVNETTDAFDKAAAIDTYTKAVDELKSKIPGLAEQLKKLKDVTDLNKTAWEGLVAAFKIGDFSKVAEIIRLWGDARTATSNAIDRKQFDTLPDSSKSLVDRIIYVEGGQDGTGPSTSSARGIGQFTEGTWLGMFDKLFPALTQLTDAQKLLYRSNEAYARPMLEELTKQNQVRLANAGVAPTDANSYLAHFLGAGDAIKVILANPDELASKIVSPASVKANPSVITSTTTAADLQAWALSKVGGGSPIMAGGQTKQEDFDSDIKTRIKGWQEEAAARKESNREAEIAKALSAAEAEATSKNTTLSKEQAAAIREAVGAKYDSAHADEQLKKNQEDAKQQLADIIGLNQQRKTLLEEIAMAQNAGDGGKAAALSAQLTAINTQLAEAIPKALELAKTLGDEKMVAQLGKVSLATQKIGSQFSLAGLSFNQLRDLASQGVDSLVSAFDGFAQAIAAGEKPMRALRNAFLTFASDFLRQIASMILKQQLFNLLNSLVPGLNLGLPTGHTGGLVGSAAIGGGNSNRQVSPSWFSNAMRYHGGGIAGLRPDEVPAVLKRNEEVLTEEDPRHRFNNNQGEKGAQGGQSLKQVLVLDPRDIANAMSSSHGEKVILTALKNNRQTAKSILS